MKRDLNSPGSDHMQQTFSGDCTRCQDIQWQTAKIKRLEERASEFYADLDGFGVLRLDQEARAMHQEYLGLLKRCERLKQSLARHIRRLRKTPHDATCRPAGEAEKERQNVKLFMQRLDSLRHLHESMNELAHANADIAFEILQGRQMMTADERKRVDKLSLGVLEATTFYQDFSKPVDTSRLPELSLSLAFEVTRQLWFEAMSIKMTAQNIIKREHGFDFELNEKLWKEYLKASPFFKNYSPLTAEESRVIDAAMDYEDQRKEKEKQVIEEKPVIKAKKKVKEKKRLNIKGCVGEPHHNMGMKLMDSLTTFLESGEPPPIDLLAEVERYHAITSRFLHHTQSMSAFDKDANYSVDELHHWVSICMATGVMADLRRTNEQLLKEWPEKMERLGMVAFLEESLDKDEIVFTRAC